MRYSGASPRRVIATTTVDAGQHWSPPAKLALSNPDAAISGVVLTDGRILMALNDTEQSRDALSLVVSSDGGKSWKTVYQLEDQRGQPTGQGTLYASRCRVGQGHRCLASPMRRDYMQDPPSEINVRCRAAGSSSPTLT